MDAPSHGGPDAVLVARLRGGDEAAYAELLTLHGGRMLAVARRLLRNEADAQDAVQEAFLQAFRSLESFERRATLGTWLHRITVNACLMRLRSRKRRPEQSIDELLPHYDPSGHHLRRPEPWPPRPDAPLEREERRRIVRDAIDSLPESHRTALLLRDIEGLGNDEVAQALGISPGASKVRVHRARQALRTLLDARVRGGEV